MKETESIIKLFLCNLLGAFNRCHHVYNIAVKLVLLNKLDDSVFLHKFGLNFKHFLKPLQ